MGAGKKKKIKKEKIYFPQMNNNSGIKPRLISKTILILTTFWLDNILDLYGVTSNSAKNGNTAHLPGASMDSSTGMSC